MKTAWKTAAVMAAVLFFSPVFAEGGTRVGGHIKLTLFDTAFGVHSNKQGEVYSSQNAGFGLMAAMLYFSQEINNNLSVEVQPMMTAISGATPSLGINIGEQLLPASNVSLKFSGVEWGVASIRLTLPEQGLELAAGILKPRFTMEYGNELFWEEEISGGKFAINYFLGAMQSAGIEAIKIFETDGISVPVYLYLLNGTTQFSDNNNQPSVMLHVEPEIGKIKLFGSFAAGKYDDAERLYMMRWSGGVNYTLQAFSIRAEYAGGRWQDGIAGAADATPAGVYAKVFYSINPWMKLMYHFDYVYHNFKGFTSFSAGPAESYITHTAGAVFKVMDSFIQFRVDIADWSRSDGSDSLLFTRISTGWRVTF